MRREQEDAVGKTFDYYRSVWANAPRFDTGLAPMPAGGPRTDLPTRFAQGRSPVERCPARRGFSRDQSLAVTCSAARTPQ